jgi:hypothetical protein
MKPAFDFLYRYLGVSLAGICIFFLYVYFTSDYQMSSATEQAIYIAILAGAFLFTVTWTAFDKKINAPRLYYLLQLIIRCTLAYMFITYALAKLCGTQFGADPETYKKPVGELDSFSLAWIFFGHSYRYGIFIASTQIIAAILLLVRHTQTLAALMFFGILSNILVIDFEFNVVTMQLVSVILFIMTLYLLWYDRQRIISFARGKQVLVSRFATAGLSRFQQVSWCAGVAVVLIGILLDAITTYRILHP